MPQKCTITKRHFLQPGALTALYSDLQKIDKDKSRFCFLSINHFESHLNEIFNIVLPSIVRSLCHAIILIDHYYPPIPSDPQQTIAQDPADKPLFIISTYSITEYAEVLKNELKLVEEEALQISEDPDRV